MYPSSLAQVRAMIKKKYPKLNLARGRGEGYYYFFSDDEELDTKLSSLNSTSVYVYSVKQLSLDKWMEEADSIMKQVSLKESRVHSNKVMTEDKSGWPVEERNLVEEAQEVRSIGFTVHCSEVVARSKTSNFSLGLKTNESAIAEMVEEYRNGDAVGDAERYDQTVEQRLEEYRADLVKEANGIIRKRLREAIQISRDGTIYLSESLRKRFINVTLNGQQVGSGDSIEQFTDDWKMGGVVSDVEDPEYDILPSS